MPKRNEMLETGKLYCIRKPDGKYYRVFSKSQLNRMIAAGKVEEDDMVQIIRSITF